MKLLTSRNGSYLTGNEIADAVMDYGLALARRQELDVVDIPFVGTDGDICRVQLMIGWLTDTAAVSDGHLAEELLESDTTLALVAKAESVGVIHAQPFSEDELSRMQGNHVEPIESY
jgi:hypothetical protein